MSIIICVIYPYSKMLVEDTKGIGLRGIPLQQGKVFVYEMKRKGKGGFVIGEVEIEEGSIVNRIKYETPRQLSDFLKTSTGEIILRAPQSWMYAEEKI